MEAGDGGQFTLGRCALIISSMYSVASRLVHPYAGVIGPNFTNVAKSSTRASVPRYATWSIAPKCPVKSNANVGFSGAWTIGLKRAAGRGTARSKKTVMFSHTSRKDFSRHDKRPTRAPVRIAIIGAGAVSDYHHVPGIRLDPRAELGGGLRQQ